MMIPSDNIPLIPLKNNVVFPEILQEIKVGRERTRQAVKAASLQHYWVVTVLEKQKPAGRKDLKDSDDAIQTEDFESVGTLARIDSIRDNRNGPLTVVLKGIKTVKLGKVTLSGDHLTTSIDPIEIEQLGDEGLSTSFADNIKSLVFDITRQNPQVQIPYSVFEKSALDKVIYWLTYHLDFSLTDKQALLEIRSVKDKGLWLLQELQRLKDKNKVETEIRQKMNQRVSDLNKKTILKEQIRLIQDELGENDSEEDLKKIYEDKILAAGLPEAALKIARKELKKLASGSSMNPEAHIVRNYLDFLLELPWNKRSGDANKSNEPPIAKSTLSSDEDNVHTETVSVIENAQPIVEEINLETARSILNAEHYGLDKIKKRILEHLALMKLKGLSQSPVLLFVGPPGVGKTTLVRSISKSLNREMTRLSLGSLRDDSELRGHRRTYIGAMAGRLLNSIRKVGVKNPVFLLDELDKMNRSVYGDPASVLLEVLDPEQNKEFLDFYLDTGFDLSEVLFIATANSTENIPQPLLDRMEVIDLGSYTRDEKINIALQHVWPQALNNNGLEKAHFENLSAKSLGFIVDHYTREAGVRGLKKQIDSLMRSCLNDFIKDPNTVFELSANFITEKLGPERFISKNIIPLETGMSRGLAWTPVGGDVLLIESTVIPGRGKLILTGKLGDVMKESSQIALTLCKNILASSHVDVDFSSIDIHLHFPEGAIPKDGPSAGVTILSSLLSLFTNQTLDSDLAMTGEVSLRGQVMPVGGIKEKVLGAHREGLKRIILPIENKKDLYEIPETVKKDMEFIFVKNVSELSQNLFPSLTLNLDVNRILLDFRNQAQSSSLN